MSFSVLPILIDVFGPDISPPRKTKRIHHQIPSFPPRSRPHRISKPAIHATQPADTEPQPLADKGKGDWNTRDEWTDEDAKAEACDEGEKAGGDGHKAKTAFAALHDTKLQVCH